MFSSSATLFLTTFIGITISSNVNVGTTLFQTSDAQNHCWSKEERDLLIARRIMQDLLPDPGMVDFQDKMAFSTILQYFRMCFDVVRSGSDGQTQEHLIKALADSVGGYMRSILLPIAKTAFYSGYIDIDGAESLYFLYDDIKELLKTPGHTWVPPNESYQQKFIISSLEIDTEIDPNACEALIFDYLEEQELSMPLPVFDDVNNPTAVVLPMDDSPLNSLSSNKSVNVVSEYYTSVLKCFAAKGAGRESVVKYNSLFYDWIKEQVVPLLEREEFYPAFGGIFRVTETMKIFGIGVKNEGGETKYDFLFNNGVPLKVDRNSSKDRNFIQDVLSDIAHHHNTRPSIYVFVAAALTTLFLFVCCCTCLMKGPEKGFDWHNFVSSIKTIIRKNYEKNKNESDVKPDESVRAQPLKKPESKSWLNKYRDEKDPNDMSGKSTEWDCNRKDTAIWVKQSSLPKGKSESNITSPRSTGRNPPHTSQSFIKVVSDSGTATDDETPRSAKSSSRLCLKIRQ